MIFRATLIVFAFLPAVCIAQDRTELCETLSSELVALMASPPLNRDYRLYDVDAFYSDKLDACIHVEKKLIGPEVFVRDLTRSVIRNDNAYYPPALMHCDVSGIDEADISAVREHRGSVSHVPLEEWMSDGQGGLPRALKTPSEPFRRADCENALTRWLNSWGP
ncbi:hypothetical protein [Sulfitobacter sp. 1A13679]|uniref:hypothetical protein n=1 Tax=Sulfitobacter sp. 1A13679 TaxID=3368597 RepID=UPI00374714A7